MTSELLPENQTAPICEDDVHLYLNEICQFPLLNPQQERDLARRCAQGDMDAIRQMVNSNLRLVVSVAKEYVGRGVPLMDLIQEGSIGLLTAAKKFDYTLDFRFSTYATKWIRQGVTRCLANHGMIRVPSYTAERIRTVISVRSEWLKQYGLEPTVEELAEKCAMTAEKVRQLLRLYPEMCSLDAPAGDDDASLAVLLEDVHAPQPYEELVREELNQTVNALLSGLTERQQYVIRLHFGMEDGNCYTLEEIGKFLGVSKERARQIEHQALDKLQMQGAFVGLEDFLE